jgi:hypothetical protein
MEKLGSRKTLESPPKASTHSVHANVRHQYWERRNVHDMSLDVALRFVVFQQFASRSRTGGMLCYMGARVSVFLFFEDCVGGIDGIGGARFSCINWPGLVWNSFSL